MTAINNCFKNLIANDFNNLNLFKHDNNYAFYSIADKNYFTILNCAVSFTSFEDDPTFKMYSPAETT